MTESLDVFVRGYPLPPKTRPFPRLSELGPSDWSLVFDTETTTGTSQRLRVGSYQIRYGDTLIEEGLFYDPEALTRRELRDLYDYCEDTGVRLLELAEWVREVFVRVGIDLAGWIIGFNLPFDISRIATSHHRTRSGHKTMLGGFSFDIGADRNIQVKKAGARSAFIRFTQPGDNTPEARNRQAGGDAANFTGYFIDCSSLATALLSGSRTLRNLGEVLDTPTRKLDIDDYGAPIDAEFLEYALVDCQVTWECFTRLRDRYEALGLDRPMWRIISEASVGKAYLDQMGLRPWAEIDTEFPDWLVACVMDTYYGGRTETRIRRQAVCGVYVDFLSQYPTVHALQELWRYQIAQWVDWHEEDPDTATQLLDGLTADTVLTRSFWRELPRIVLIAPDDGDRLPTRAPYGADSTLNVALADRYGGPAQWYTLADAAASVLETGRTPTILRTIRFEPGPPQEDLKPIEIGDHTINPSPENVVARFIEIRRDIKTQLSNASEDAKPLLDARQLAVKITANSVAYGIGIEMNPAEYTKDRDATIVRPDGTSYDIRTNRIEAPGRWFHPVIATLTAAGGRLLIATAMRLVHDAGGEYVFSDTDSLFIAATRTGDKEAGLLSWAQVTAITDRFRALNPYGFGGSILELEDENYLHGEQTELWCWSIASKRYALYRIIDGRITLATNNNGDPKRSEHGLGHLINPIAGSDDWISRWWEHLLAVELSHNPEDPEWFDRPAIGKLGVTSHHELTAFTNHNTDLAYVERVRPFGFMLVAHVEPLIATMSDVPACLVAGYENDPRRWTGLDWYDRANKTSPTYRIRTTDVNIRRSGEIPVQTIGTYFTTYRLHPESKAADGNGDPCRAHTRGLLRPRTIHATGLLRIGKEATRLNEGPLTTPSDRAVRYPEPVCRKCEAPLVGKQRQWCSDRCRVAAGRGGR